MSINKLVVLIAAFMLASFLGSMPVAAQVVCDPSPITNPTGDCDLDGIPNSVDTCDNLDPNPLLDCDGDGVPNSVDQECPYTIVGADLVVGACTIDVGTAIFSTGCSLTEVLSEDLDDCAEGATNHGKYVSCVAKVTNALKKQKMITGKQKGQIQSCAAQSDVGKKP